jgi:DNA-binding NarL/FixJ family response regulator
MAIKVALVKNNVGLRISWARLISNTPGFQCICVCSSSEKALKKLPPATPEVVLMDISLSRMSGIECAALLKQRLPQAQILIVTVHSDNDRVFAALQAGASGYHLKRTGPPGLLEAISDVMRSGAPMTDEIARKVIAAFQRSAPAPIEDARLTPREEDILGLVTRGYADKEIAEHLGVGYKPCARTCATRALPHRGRDQVSAGSGTKSIDTMRTHSVAERIPQATASL